jgi:hypothetical protein
MGFYSTSTAKTNRATRTGKRKRGRDEATNGRPLGRASAFLVWTRGKKLVMVAPIDSIFSILRLVLPQTSTDETLFDRLPERRKENAK